VPDQPKKGEFARLTCGTAGLLVAEALYLPGQDSEV
jgi:hypothetical protein